jgi:hypothetical protein
VVTSASLNSCTCKDLAEMARKRGVSGWHSMRKDQLVRALVRLAQSKVKKPTVRSAAKKTRPTPVPVRRGTTLGPSAKASSKSPSPKAPAKLAPNIKRAQPRVAPKPHLAANGHAANGHTAVKPRVAAKPPVKLEPQSSPRVQKRIAEIKARLERARDLAAKTIDQHPVGERRDRVVLMVRDAFWLHVYWELTRPSVERAKAAMGQDWHVARPVLRLIEVADTGTTNAAERVVRDIEVHGGVNNWYIDVKDPPKNYRVEIGYRASTSGRFHVLGRSNVVTTPKANPSGTIDQNWADIAANFDKVYAMSGGYAETGDNTELRELFEERLRRPMGSPMVTRFGNGVRALLPSEGHFDFEVDAEMIVFGSTRADAYVTIKGEPIRLREDGTFTVRMSMPEAREVIPIVASTSDGVEQRTVVLSIDRNTKVMEPMIRDGNS